MGCIRVLESGSRRYLAFGEQAEQSCIDMLNPQILVYEYTQAMMLALIFFPRPRSVTFLGLGAGSMLHSVQVYDPQIELHVVELRSKIVEVAKNWFGLPCLANMHLNIEDAFLYMAQNPAKCDCIFADIYNDDGMLDSQLSDEFLRNCYQALNREGVLVMNLWDEGKGQNPGAIKSIFDQFGVNALTCQVEDGNLIAFAFKGGVPQINLRRLLPIAKRLGKKLNFPAGKLLGRIKVT